MTFDELQELAEKDLKLNDTELDIESLKTPQLHNKYSKFHNQYINLLKKAEQDRDVMVRDKWEYYTGKADASVYQAKPFNLKILPLWIPPSSLIFTFPLIVGISVFVPSAASEKLM